MSEQTITRGRELERASWERYFDIVSPELVNSDTTVEVIDASGRRHAAIGLALQTLTYDRRNDVFEVACARGSPHLPSVLRHVVERPTRIEVDAAGTLAPTRIVVEDEQGTRTLIKLAREGEFAG